MGRILIILIVMLPLGLHAQMRVSEVFVRSNYTHIADQEKDANITHVNPSTGFVSITVNGAVLAERYQGRFGLDLGCSLSALALSNRLSLSTGATLSLKRFRRNDALSSIDNVIPRGNFISVDGTPIGIIHGNPISLTDSTLIIRPLIPMQEEPANEKVGETNIVFLQLPVTIDYTITKRITANAGLAASILLISAVYEAGTPFYSTANGVVSNSEANWNMSSDGLSNVLIEATTNIAYSVAKGWKIELGYWRSLTPIFDASRQTVGKARFNTFSLGASYTLPVRSTH
jgi:hypothetical protein